MSLNTTFKSYFSNEHAKGDSKIMLIVKEKFLLKNQAIASEFNEYFGQIVDSFELYHYPSRKVNGLIDDID